MGRLPVNELFVMQVLEGQSNLHHDIDSSALANRIASSPIQVLCEWVVRVHSSRQPRPPLDIPSDTRTHRQEVATISIFLDDVQDSLF